MSRIVALLTLLLLPALGLAETRYVGDNLLLPLRSGPGTQYRILHHGLKSGTALEVLGQSDDGSYLQVRAGRMEGWVSSQHVSREPVAAVQLQTVRQQLKTLQDENARLRQQLQERDSQLQQLQQSTEQATEQASQSIEELAEIRRISANAIQLNNSNRELVQENEKLRTLVNLNSTEIERLKSSEQQGWFLKGAFAVLLGAVLALLIPRLVPRRKRSDWV